ncbi:MAG: ABC transporter permease [Chloroflexota bacterium]|nr:ABC transporter permease [Chloroflexota bacterium]
MFKYLMQRIIAAIPVMVGILFVTFALARLLPGDPCVAMLGERANEETCSAFNERYGLDKPMITQFLIYFNDVLHGDLGISFRYGKPVTELVIERLPVTVELAMSAMFIAITVGMFLGIVSAKNQNSSIDVLTMMGANLGVSIPVFVLGLLLAYIFAIVLKDTPFALAPSGRLSAGMSVPSLAEKLNIQEGDALYTPMEFLSNLYLFNAVVTLNGELLLDSFKHLILPAVALGTIPLAIIARLTRSSLLEVIGSDYTRTARAKGLSERVVLIQHALRNALLPVVTIIGLSLGFLLSGAVLTETIFGFSGVGRILFDSILARDYAVIQGFTLVTAVGFLIINLVVDILYGFLDPRIRLG